VIYSDGAKVQNIQFINDSLGYALGYLSGNGLLLKTTNKGYNWTIMQNSGSVLFGGFYMVNADTGWISAWSFPSGLILRTTNGFQTIENICSGTGETPATLYFFKEKYNGEYCGYILGGGDGILSKTTNSGYNWQPFSLGGDVYGFNFINRDTGWAVIDTYGSNNKILKTINGGINWITQFSDSLQNYRVSSIFAVNNNLLWCGLSSGTHKILKSSDGGNIWGSQASQVLANTFIYIVDSLIGFAWNASQTVKTANGGGPITRIENISIKIPESLMLEQNYPNPFNSKTTIEFDIAKSSVISLILYDLLGREIMKIITLKELSTGSYKTIIDFENNKLSSGIYFYRLMTFEKESGKFFQLTKKLIYNK
jgi:photosystem II stability/assembly factor-like uncharacterized protein